ncbi:MAG: topoisomerase DNA-binding C4 zinc finger domain-containing protein [Sedimenticola sp.]
MSTWPVEATKGTTAPEKIEPIAAEKHEDRLSLARESVVAESKGVCPKCASELVKRVASKGKHKGSEFIAYSAYPRCRYVTKQVVQRDV